MIIRPAQPIATSNKPQTDRRAVFANVQNETGEIDLLIAQQTERFGQLRCIYIDTSAQDTNGNGCVIETDLGQNITALAQTQGYYPVFLPFVSKLKISSNQAVNILLLDFDMQPSIWPTALASSNVPDPLHVIIDDQPIATSAEVQNWPAVQPVSISGQPTHSGSKKVPASVGTLFSGPLSVKQMLVEMIGVSGTPVLVLYDGSTLVAQFNWSGLTSYTQIISLNNVRDYAGDLNGLFTGNTAGSCNLWVSL